MKIARIAAVLAAGLALSAFAAFAATPQLALYGENALLVKGDGTLWAWGRPAYNAFTGGVLRPVPHRIGASSVWKQVSSGQPNAGIHQDGSLWAWGGGPAGIGDGSLAIRVDPVRIGAANDWVKVSTGQGHALAIRGDGTLWAWGFNSSGQVGDGTNLDRTAPVQVGTASNWAQVFAGPFHSMAIRTDGTLWAWGNNTASQLGDGTSINRNVPTQVGIDTDWKHVAPAQSHTLALKTDGSVWGWGPVGLVQRIPVPFPPPVQSTPMMVLPPGDWVKLAASNSHHAAIKSDGTLWTWGQGFNGALGSLPAETLRSAPAQVGSETTWVDVAVSQSHNTIAMKGDGSVWGWGISTSAPVGDGTHGYRLEPAPVPAGVTFVQMSSAGQRGALITDSGRLWIFQPQSSPASGTPLMEIADPGPFTRVSAGEGLLLALRADGRIFNVTTGFATQVGSDADWVDVSAGSQHALALKSNGSLWAWGQNGNGQLGIGTTVPASLPVRVSTTVPPTDEAFVRISAAGNHSVAARADGRLFSWGVNQQGQLGDGTLTQRLSPVAVANVPVGAWAFIASSVTHNFARLASGETWAWGGNNQGELGTGAQNFTPLPPQRVPLDELVSITAGNSTSMGIKADGSLWVWGFNRLGMLGLGSISNTILTPVRQGADTWVYARASSDAAAGLRSNGQLHYWANMLNVFGAFDPRLAWTPRRALVSANAPSASLASPLLANSHVADFGMVGATRSVSFTFSADTPVSISSIAATAPFTASHDCPIGTATTACTIQVSFTPTRLGSVTGTLAITSDADVGHAPLALAGIGVVDGTPDPFSFGTLTEAPMAATVVSGPVTPAGFSGAAAISVTNGEYCVSSSAGCACDVKPFTTVAGSLTAGQSVCARHTSSALPATSTVTTVTVGGVGGTFTSTTERATPTVTLVSAPNPSRLSENVVFTATVGGAFGPATGLVHFSWNGASVAVAPVVNGSAWTATSSLATGSHTFAASYAGDAKYKPAASDAIVHMVLGANSAALGTVLDFNGDGQEDALIPAENGTATVYLMNGSTVIGTATIVGPGAAWSMTHVTDLNGDGKSDLVWQRQPGEVELWLMQGSTPLSQVRLTGVPPDARVAHIGDFNRDGRTDLVWASRTGRVDVWLMDGVAATASATIENGGTGRTLAAVGDLDGDGKSDLVWVDGSGVLSVSLMDGVTVRNDSTVAAPAGLSGFTFRGMADLDGNGRQDLVVTASNGQTVAFAMNGASIVASGVLTSDPLDGLKLGDLNGDGRSDVVLELKDGTVVAHLMNGVAAVASAVLPQDGKKWVLLRASDLDSDGKADLVWNEKNGRGVEAWMMNGLTVASRQRLR